MKTVFISFLLSLFLFWVPKIAQTEQNNFHQKTKTPLDARYELIQSEISTKWTFRLDRYTGQVYQLVDTTRSDGKAWEKMIVSYLPEIQNANKPRFILFTSGIAYGHTFLMDTKTGKTWYLSVVRGGLGKAVAATINIWKPFKD
jgi:hypothetical protein